MIATLRKRAGRDIIGRAIRDLASSDPTVFEDAVSYVQSDNLETHRQWAEYPSSLIDILADMSDQSLMQRKILAKQAISLLKSEW